MNSRTRAILFSLIALVGVSLAAEKGLRETRLDGDVHIGPIYDRHRRPLDKARETEMVAPLLQWARTPTTSEFALRPFFAWGENREINHSEWQFLYPFLTYTRYGPEARWQLWTLRFSKLKRVDAK